MPASARPVSAKIGSSSSSNTSSVPPNVSPNTSRRVRRQVQHLTNLRETGLGPLSSSQASPVHSTGTAGSDETIFELDDYFLGMSSAKSMKPSTLSKLDTQTIPLEGESLPKSVIYAPKGFEDFGKEVKTPLEQIHSASQYSTKMRVLLESAQAEGLANVASARSNRGSESIESESTIRPIAVKSSSQDEGDGSTNQNTGGKAGENNNAHPQHKLEDLRQGLTECWTFCRTLCELSQETRNASYTKSRKPQAVETTFNSCFMLCQAMYMTCSGSTKDEGSVESRLKLCKDLFHGLLTLRPKDDHDKETLIRNAIALSTHLQTGLQPDLPPAFHERTLRFYLTSCSRLVTILATASNAAMPIDVANLIQACWVLIGAFYALAQHKRQDPLLSPTNANEHDLLDIAIESCFKLCNLFRASRGPSSSFPTRPTLEHFRSRPGSRDTAYALIYDDKDSDSGSDHSSTPRGHDIPNKHEPAAPTTPTKADVTSEPPDTPGTLFEDLDGPSLFDAGRKDPNILVFGKGNDLKGPGERWESVSQPGVQSSRERGAEGDAERKRERERHGVMDRVREKNDRKYGKERERKIAGREGSSSRHGRRER